ncbi:hypothetical protein HYW82_03735 [Candidatus Peregrinibacteria bacterium]|nr:hypothetical protein [Candidatus Peregrinibacteria bacterium]
MENCTLQPMPDTPQPTPQGSQPQPQSGGNGKIIAAIVAVVIIALGAAAYFFWPQISAKFFKNNEQPPQFSITIPKFQGLLSADQLENPVCQLPGLETTDEMVTKYDELKGSTTAMSTIPVKAGINFIPSLGVSPKLVDGEDTAGDTTGDDVLNMVKPVADNKIFVVYYNNGFNIYPALGIEGINDIDNINNLVIPDGEGVIILSCLDTEFLYAGASLPETIKNGTIGDDWVLTSASDKTLDEFSAYEKRIKSIWYLKSYEANDKGFYLAPEFAKVTEKVTEDVYGSLPKDAVSNVIWVKLRETGDTMTQSTIVVKNKSALQVKNKLSQSITNLYVKDYVPRMNIIYLTWDSLENADEYAIIYELNGDGPEPKNGTIRNVETVDGDPYIIRQYLTSSGKMVVAKIGNIAPGKYKFGVAPKFKETNGSLTNGRISQIEYEAKPLKETESPKDIDYLEPEGLPVRDGTDDAELTNIFNETEKLEPAVEPVVEPATAEPTTPAAEPAVEPVAEPMPSTTDSYNIIAPTRTNQPKQ